MRFILSFVFFISSLIYSQAGYLIHEIHLLPGRESCDLYYSFRIPYNRLVFEKAQNGFSAEYEVMVELWDSNGAVTQRLIETKQVSAADFEETNSEDLYSEGMLYFNTPEDKIKINALFTDKKSSKELRLTEREFLLNDFKQIRFLPPLVVYAGKQDCGGNLMYRLANFEGNIPFTEEPMEIILPAVDLSLQEVRAEISKDDSIYWKGIVNQRQTGSISLKDCGSIMMDIKDSIPEKSLNNFVISGVSPLLPEGVYSLKVSDGEDDKFFEITVKWYNRPVSLTDPEYAILALRHIEDESKVKELIDNKSSEFRRLLNEYWEKSDPTPGTQFNPLMEEFYQRIDYAARNFSSLLKKDGVTTDRGMIFIKYGRPVKIERSYTGTGEALETWLYEKNKFIFVDSKGTGEFLLIKG